MKSKTLLDSSFRYTPSFGTNLKATFARVRREMREAQARAAADEATKRAQMEQKRPARLTKIFP